MFFMCLKKSTLWILWNAERWSWMRWWNLYQHPLPVEAAASCSCCHGTCDVVLQTTMSDDCRLKDVLKHRTMYVAPNGLYYTNHFTVDFWCCQVSRQWPSQFWNFSQISLVAFSRVFLLIFSYMWVVLVLPSVYWHCCLGSKPGILSPVKTYNTSINPSVLRCSWLHFAAFLE